MFAPSVRPAASRWSPLVVAVAWAVAAAAAVLIASALARGLLVYPGCALKYLTGIPCPACGDTRCFAALSRGDIEFALKENPLAAAGALAAWLGVPLTWLDVVANRGRGAAVFMQWLRQRWLRGSLVALVLLNWVYLVVEGR